MNLQLSIIFISLAVLSGCAATAYVDDMATTSYGRYNPYKINRAVTLDNTSILMCFHGSFIQTSGMRYGATIEDTEFAVLISRITTSDKKYEAKTIEIGCSDYIRKYSNKSSDIKTYIIRTKNQCIDDRADHNSIQCISSRCNNSEKCEGVHWIMHDDKTMITSGYATKEKHRYRTYYSSLDLVKAIDKTNLAENALFVVEETFTIRVEKEEQEELSANNVTHTHIEQVHNDIYYTYNGQILFFELKSVSKEGSPVWHAAKPLSVAVDIITIPIQVPLMLYGASQIGK